MSGHHGWRASGVDFSATAIRSARRAADGVTGATFLEGDVNKLSQLPLEKPIDLVLDMGCYHCCPMTPNRPMRPSWPRSWHRGGR